MTFTDVRVHTHQCQETETLESHHFLFPAPTTASESEKLSEGEVERHADVCECERITSHLRLDTGVSTVTEHLA